MSSVRLFDDFTVGEFWHSRPETITEASIIAFARDNDPQPMHVDPAVAANGPHGSVIASGWQIAALSLKLFVEAGGYGGTPVLGLGCDELRWREVVRPGDVLTAHREIIELRRSASRPGQGVIRTRITVTNQHDRTVLSMLSTGMVPTRDS
jgi:acyl dehydratase